MEFCYCFNSLEYLAEDGYGPLDHTSSSTLEEHLGAGQMPTSPILLSVVINPRSQKPQLLVPQATTPHLIGRILIENDLFEARMSASSEAERSFDMSFGQGMENSCYLLCKSKFSDSNASQWIDFKGSRFAVAKSISLSMVDPPLKVEDGISLADHSELLTRVEKLTTLRVLVPEILKPKLGQLPEAFEFQGRVFFCENVVSDLSNGKLKGLVSSGTRCTLRN